MKRIVALLLAVMIVMSMAVTASACTPRLKIPKVPQISSIQLQVQPDEDLEEAIDNQVENHVSKWICKIDFSKLDFSRIRFN